MEVILKVTFFLLWVNFLPPLAAVLFSDRFGTPVDGGLTWRDGRPLLGPHKTLRGVFFSLAGGTAAWPLLGSVWLEAFWTSILVVLGDLATSFIKRRLDYGSGDVIFVVDHLLEAMLPLAALSIFLPLSWLQSGVILFLFIATATSGSQFWAYIVYRAPEKNYPRIVRSSVRLKEWRACHQPQSRFHYLLNLESILSNHYILTGLFKLSGLYEQGIGNAGDIQYRREEFFFEDLPEPFDGFRILFATDLHLDGLPALTDRIIGLIADHEYDLCLLGGDFRMKVYGSVAPSVRRLRRLVGHIRSWQGILGVLGNHDCIEMLPDLEDTGMVMLVNDSWPVSKSGEEIWIVGLDDPHYYKTHDLATAYGQVPGGAFVVLLAHSPEALQATESYAPQLYLCGHTHGGQIRLPGCGPLFTNSRASRQTAAGRWQHGVIQGFTSTGAGASGVPLRFNCPGELVEIVLRRRN